MPWTTSSEERSKAIARWKAWWEDRRSQAGYPKDESLTKVANRPGPDADGMATRASREGPTPSSPATTPAAATGTVLLNPARAAAGLVVYLGRLALLTSSALGAAIRPAFACPPFHRQSALQLDRVLAMAMPLVGLVHVGLGSFLSMQAYFGATFMDGIGPVTGVGLIRNLAPLMTGFIVAGVVSARFVAEPGRRRAAVGRGVADGRDPARGREPGRAGPVGLGLAGRDRDRLGWSPTR